MAQFDVYRNPNRAARKAVPYLVDVQTDLLTGITTRLLAPLVPVAGSTRPVAKLNPIVNVQGEKFVLRMQELAGVPIERFGASVGTLHSQRGEILAALDLLITGI